MTLMLAVALFTACDNKRIVDVFEPITDNNWSYVDTVSVGFTVLDTTKTYNLYLNVRHSGTYAYRNLYVRMHLTNPAGERGTQVVSFELADASGKWHGKGLGDIYEYRVKWRDGAKFKLSGDYQVQIEQFMREDPLPGILDIGLRLELAEE
jgi:gliding motility-associated lipoprotein GldH